MDDVPPDGGNGSDEEVTIDPEREAYYKSDPKKALHKFFEREGKCSTMVLCAPLPRVYCSTMVLCGPLPRVYCSTMVLCGPLPRVYCSTMGVLYMFQFPHLPLLNLSPLPPPHSSPPHSLLPIPLLKGLELEYETEESGTDRSISFTCRVRCVWGWCVMCVWRYVGDGVMCAYGGVVIHVLCLKIEETSW